MKMKNFNKKAQGIVSFAAIIILLASILASSIYFDYSITANAVKENAIDNKPPSVQVKEVKNVEELNYLNEGWYEIKKGYAYYLESFNDYVPLYIRVMNGREQNGLLVIYADGGVYFDDSFRGLPRIQVVADEKEDEEITQNEPISRNQITGKAAGTERVSGFAEVEPPKPKKITVDIPWRIDPVLESRNGRWFEGNTEIKQNVYQYIYEQYGNKFTKFTTTKNDGTTSTASPNSLKLYMGWLYSKQALETAERKDRNKALELA